MRREQVKYPAGADGQKVISESFAAFVGAIFMDQGAAAAHTFALDMLVPLLDDTDASAFLDFAVAPKKKLHALLLSEESQAPQYEIIGETGRKTHNPTFLVGAFSGDKKLGEGASYSIKEAQNEVGACSSQWRVA